MAGGAIAPGTTARIQGQIPTSGPLADAWIVPSGFSIRGPTKARRESALAANLSNPSSSSSQSGLIITTVGPLALLTPAFVPAPNPSLVEADESVGPLPSLSREIRVVARVVIDEHKLLGAVQVGVHRVDKALDELLALPSDDDQRVHVQAEDGSGSSASTN